MENSVGDIPVDLKPVLITALMACRKIKDFCEEDLLPLGIEQGGKGVDCIRLNEANLHASEALDLFKKEGLKVGKDFDLG